MKIRLVLLVVLRPQSVAYTEMLERWNPGGFVSIPCDGSTKIDKLRMLGIEQTGRLLFASVMEKKLVRRVLMEAMVNLGIATPGNGIALTIPLESIGGKSSLSLMTGMEEIRMEEGKTETVEEKNMASLIVAVVENGHVDMVMDVARAAGASGGTVIHAKGTADEMAKKFFGVTLGHEKEIIMIATKIEQRADIMRAIMDKAGVNSPAHTILFSLPVEQVVGIRSFEVTDKEKDT